MTAGEGGSQRRRHAERRAHGPHQRLSTQIPKLTIVDRSVALWVMKIGGHLLDPAPDAAEGELVARLRQSDG